MTVKNQMELLIPWFRGQSLVWDTTCYDTLAESNYLRYRSVKAGSAAQIAHNNKHRKHSYIKSMNYIFVAFAVETLGAWSK